jgi:hypothetical protein
MQFTVKEHLLSEKKEDEYIELDDQACDKIVELPELAFLDLCKTSLMQPAAAPSTPAWWPTCPRRSRADSTT